MVHVDVVDDDVGHVLNSDATAAGDVDVGATPIDRFEAIDDEFMLEPNGHILGEDDPKGLKLDHGVAEGARSWVRRIGIGRVGYDVDLAAFAADGIAAEADAAVGESLPVRRPIWVAAPAIVDGVSGEARESLILRFEG